MTATSKLELKVSAVSSSAAEQSLSLGSLAVLSDVASQLNILLAPNEEVELTELFKSKRIKYLFVVSDLPIYSECLRTATASPTFSSPTGFVHFYIFSKLDLSSDNVDRIFLKRPTGTNVDKARVSIQIAYS